MLRQLTAVFLFICVSLGLSACSLPKAANTPIPEILAQTEVKGKITVSCFGSGDVAVEEAAKLFERKFPGTKVVFEINDWKNGFYEQDEKAYLSRVNTEIMAGRGADIYAIAVLPVNKYAEQGYLDNFREYMENDPEFDETAYRQPVLDALTDDRGQFIMPLSYYFDVFLYNKAAFSQSEAAALSEMDAASFTQLVRMAKDAYDRQDGKVDYVHGGVYQRVLFQQIFGQTFSDYVDISRKQANFTDGRFADLLNTIRGYADNAEKYNETDDADITYLFNWREIGNLMDFFDEGPPQIIFRDNGTEFFTPETAGLCGIMANDAGEAAFNFDIAFGINANSGNKKAAWEFIKFMLSDEMQEEFAFYYRSYLPVNINAFNNWVEGQAAYRVGEYIDKEPFGDMVVTAPAGPLNEKGQAIYDGYTALVERYTARIKRLKAYEYDSYITDVAELEGFLPFMKGERTAEEAAAFVQNKVWLYLNE